MEKDFDWVIKGSQRRKIIFVMTRPKIPTQIKEESNLSLNNVSDVLRAFRKKNIVRVINPDAKTGRVYELTTKGKKIREDITS